MKTTLTPRQREMFDYLKKRKDYPPSYRDIMRDLGYKSTGHVSQTIKILQDRGWIEKPAKLHRCFRFL